MSELNKYPTQEVWGKKKENKPKENRKLDMNLEINEFWGGVYRREVQVGKDVCIHIVDLLHCMGETYTTL